MPIVNLVKPLVDDLRISVYQFSKETGISMTTAYRLYNNPRSMPSISTLEIICDRYKVQPDKVIKRIP